MAQVAPHAAPHRLAGRCRQPKPARNAGRHQSPTGGGGQLEACARVGVMGAGAQQPTSRRRKRSRNPRAAKQQQPTEPSGRKHECKRAGSRGGVDDSSSGAHSSRTGAGSARLSTQLRVRPQQYGSVTATQRTVKNVTGGGRQSVCGGGYGPLQGRRSLQQRTAPEAGRQAAHPSRQSLVT